MSNLVVSHDTGYDITIYRDVSCDITPDHPQTTGKQTRKLVAVYSLFWLSVFALVLDSLSSVPPSAGHTIELTAPSANKNSNPVPAGLGLLPERMYVGFCFICLFFSTSFFFLSLSVLPSWYP